MQEWEAYGRGDGGLCAAVGFEIKAGTVGFAMVNGQVQKTKIQK